MAIAADVRRVIRHVLERDRTLPPDQQTTFLLGVLSASEKAELEDSLFVWHQDGRMEVRRETFKVRALRLGLRGWENFRDAAGNALEFKTVRGASGKPVPSDEMLDLIAGEDRTELVNVITQATELSEDDRKN